MGEARGGPWGEVARVVDAEHHSEKPDRRDRQVRKQRAPHFPSGIVEPGRTSEHLLDDLGVVAPEETEELPCEPETDRRRGSNHAPQDAVVAPCCVPIATIDRVTPCLTGPADSPHDRPAQEKSRLRRRAPGVFRSRGAAHARGQ